jgi:hemerythrin-like domain-containing protein
MCDHCGCRAFAPIAELTGEHEQILTEAWMLAEATRADRPVPAEQQRALLALLDVHVAKEEAGLYPNLLEVGGLSDTDCADLEAEHRALRRALTAGRFDRPDFYALAAHIEVEEMELFSAAMLRFDEREWDHLTAVHHEADEVALLRSP